MTPAANPTLPAGELLEIPPWLNPAASLRIAMGAGTPGTAGTAGGKAPGAELVSMRVIPGLRAQAPTRSKVQSAFLTPPAPIAGPGDQISRALCPGSQIRIIWMPRPTRAAGLIAAPDSLRAAQARYLATLCN
jgi:hypothetical protein